MVQNYGEDLLRYKGILNIQGEPRRMIFQGVHMLMGGTPGKPWGAGRGARERDGVHRAAHPAPPVRGRPRVLRGMSASAPPCSRSATCATTTPDAPSSRCRRGTWRKGDASLVLGPSGSGKTTLLNVIAGLATPTAGTVRVARRGVTRLSPAARDAFRARHVGLVLQTLHLIGVVSVRENLRLAQHLAGSPVDDCAHRRGAREPRRRTPRRRARARHLRRRGAARGHRARRREPPGAHPRRRADLGARRRQLREGPRAPPRRRPPPAAPRSSSPRTTTASAGASRRRLEL